MLQKTEKKRLTMEKWTFVGRYFFSVCLKKCFKDLKKVFLKPIFWSFGWSFRTKFCFLIFENEILGFKNEFSIFVDGFLRFKNDFPIFEHKILNFWGEDEILYFLGSVEFLYFWGSDEILYFWDFRHYIKNAKLHK